MDELLPVTIIRGMADPRAWVEAVADRLPAQPPLVPPVWERREGRPSLGWSLRVGRERIAVTLTPYARHVRLEVWSQAWPAGLDVTYETYHQLVTWMGRMLIHGDPEAARLRLVVQSYAEAQASRAVG